MDESGASNYGRQSKFQFNGHLKILWTMKSNYRRVKIFFYLLDILLVDI